MDRFLTPNASFKRLLKEYQKYSQLIIAVDIDDTVFDFHDEGHTYQLVIDLVKKAKLVLDAEIIIWTGNTNQVFVEDYCKTHEIPFDRINQQSEKANKFYSDLGHEAPRKLFCNILIDDRAGLGETYRDLELLVWMVYNNYVTK